MFHTLFLLIVKAASSLLQQTSPEAVQGKTAQQLEKERHAMIRRAEQQPEKMAKLDKKIGL